MGCTVISKRMTFENILKGQLITCQSDRPKRFENECRKCTNSRLKNKNKKYPDHLHANVTVLFWWLLQLIQI